jgi:hypothetical protein
MIGLARMLNPRIDAVVRTHSEEEAELLRQGACRESVYRRT